MSIVRRFSPQRVIGQLGALYREYPPQFWVLVLGAFIDRLGGALMFPFFTLYITKKFGVGMTQVGLIFALFSISSVAGSMVGGALTDRLGRKGMFLFGLVMSATSSLLMGVVGRVELFLMVTLFVGLLANAGGPAQQAMVADLLPEEKRAEGYGILRVVVNMSFVIGPMLGGFLASRSYLLLFISDAIASVITALIVYFAIRETRAAPAPGVAQESMAQTFGGYFKVLRDTVYVWFLAASAVMVIVYLQMNTTLPVYLRDVHGLNEQMYAYILSLNAAMVVLMQFPITRRVSAYRPLNVMVAGVLLYALGFSMYGYAGVFWLFLLAMAIITLGEMLVSPVSQAIVARLAPEDMRGRYMAVFGFSWVLPSAVAPLLAGLVMDHIGAQYVWYGAGVLALFSAVMFFTLEQRIGRSRWQAVGERLGILEQLEEGRITASEAAGMLAQVSEGKYGKLADVAPAVARHVLHLRVSDLATGAMKADLHLPMGLINTVLYTGGRISPELDGFDHADLEAAIQQSHSQRTIQTLEKSGRQRVEVKVEDPE